MLSRLILRLVIFCLLVGMLPPAGAPLAPASVQAQTSSSPIQEIVTLGPQGTWTQTISDYAIVSFRCWGENIQPNPARDIQLSYQKQGDVVHTLGFCDGDRSFVVEANGAPVTIWLWNQLLPVPGVDQTRYTNIEVRPYQHLIHVTDDLPIEFSQLELKPRQRWQRTVNGYDFVLAFCGPDQFIATHVLMEYRIDDGNWSPVRNHYCNQWAGDVIPGTIGIFKKPVTIRLTNERWEYWESRTPSVTIKPFNHIVRPPYTVPSDPIEVQLQPKQTWVQQISGYDVVSVQCAPKMPNPVDEIDKADTVKVEYVLGNRCGGDGVINTPPSSSASTSSRSRSA